MDVWRDSRSTGREVVGGNGRSVGNGGDGTRLDVLLLRGDRNRARLHVLRSSLLNDAGHNLLSSGGISIARCTGVNLLATIGVVSSTYHFVDEPLHSLRGWGGKQKVADETGLLTVHPKQKVADKTGLFFET